MSFVRVARTITVSGLIGAALLLSIPQSTLADEPHTPGKGSPERKAIMDALRPVYSQYGEVVFVVNYLKVHNGWAWTDVSPLGPDNKPVAEGGPALLHYENETWKVIDLSTVPEDPKDPLGPEDASVGFVRNLRKMHPDIPLDIFPKPKH